MLTYKILATCQPAYLYDTLHPYWPAHTLRCSNQQLLQIPYMHTKFGQHSFKYCSPKMLNEILAIINASATLATFKRRLKSHLLSQLATQ